MTHLPSYEAVCRKAYNSCELQLRSLKLREHKGIDLGVLFESADVEHALDHIVQRRFRIERELARLQDVENFLTIARKRTTD